MGEWAYTSHPLQDAGQLALSQTGGRLCPGTTLLLPPWIFRHAEILESYVFYKLAPFKYFYLSKLLKSR